MLTNQTGADFKLQYNGKIVNLKPNGGVDVRDFDVANKDVLATEKHIMTKHPGTFLQSKSTGDPARDKQIAEENDGLRKQLESVSTELAAQRKVNEDLTAKHQASNGEIQTLKQNIASLKTENDALASKFDEQEHEIEGLRKQIATGKTASQK